MKLQKIILLLCLIIQTACLKPKKSLFDFNSPAGGFFGILISNLSSSNGSRNSSPNTNNLPTETNTIKVSGKINLQNLGKFSLQNLQTAKVDFGSNLSSYSITVSKGAYSIKLVENPLGYICSIKKSEGNSNSDINDADMNCENFSEKRIYSETVNSNSSWSYYVKNDRTDIFSATNTACDPNQNTGGYRSCIHAGEIFQFQTNESSCGDLTLEENLSAFNWLCVVKNNKASFYSTGLNSGKYLSDLIDFTTQRWKKNKIKIKKNNFVLLESNDSEWWTNKINWNNNSLTNQSEIYVFTSDPLTTLPINNNRISLVLKSNSGFQLGTSGCGTNGAIGGASRYFTWIEVDYLRGTGDNDGKIKLSGNYNVLKNIKIQNGFSTCSGKAFLNIPNLNNSHLEDIRLADGANNSNGILMNNSNYNSFININISNFQNTGIQFQTSASIFNIFMNVIISNINGIGVNNSSNSRNNQFYNANFINNNNADFISSSDNQYLKNIVLLNSNNGPNLNDSNLWFQGSTNISIENLISNLNNASVNKFNIKLETPASLYITGHVKLTFCSSTGSTGINSTCAATGTSDFNNGGASITTNYTSGTGFLEKAIIDSKNLSHTSGIATFLNTTDFLNFDKFHRNYGISSGVFPSSAQRGSGMINDSMAIYDWSLKNTDTYLRNTNLCPSITGYSSNAVSVVLTNGTKNTLRNAVERIGDGIGNDDGFCESNEDCIYTPNIGAYQGHGNLIRANIDSPTTNKCEDITTGTVQNVKLWKYETNGY